jgi:hypothetical protein
MKRFSGLRREPLLFLLSVVLSACSAGALNKPIKMGDVDTGPGTPEYVRRQLEGRWHLTSLTVFSAAGQPTAVPAEAELVYDAYGNITIRGRLKNAAAGAPAGVLNQNGRAVIDATKAQIRFVDTKGQSLDPSTVSDAVSFEHVRLYEFADNTHLTLTTVDANGQRTARTVWRKVH